MMYFCDCAISGKQVVKGSLNLPLPSWGFMRQPYYRKLPWGRFFYGSNCNTILIKLLSNIDFLTYFYSSFNWFCTPSNLINNMLSLIWWLSQYSSPKTFRYSVTPDLQWYETEVYLPHIYSLWSPVVLKDFEDLIAEFLCFYQVQNLLCNTRHILRLFLLFVNWTSLPDKK